MIAAVQVPGHAGTLVLDRPAPTRGGGYQRLVLVRGTHRTTVLDLATAHEAIALNGTPQDAVSPDGLYLLTWRSEGLGQAGDGGPARQSLGIVGVEEEDFVSFQDSNGLSVGTDTILRGWDKRFPHLLVVERNARRYPAVPLGEALPAQP